MLREYDDITSRIDVQPTWYDEQGVPRYEPFQPDMLGVYDDIASLQKIACQDCGRRFLVAQSSELTRRLMWFGVEKANAVTALEIARAHYGDPPRHGCVGDTMNVELVAVMEVWRKNKCLDWCRLRGVERQANAQLDECLR